MKRKVKFHVPVPHCDTRFYVRMTLRQMQIPYRFFMIDGYDLNPKPVETRFCGFERIARITLTL